MTIAAVPRPPRFVADTPEAVNETANSASRVTRESLSERRGFRNLQISAIPYLRASPAGATFLRQAGPRALARGEPAANCPASTASQPGQTTREAAARSALSACHAQLAARGAEPSCGCRLIATDNALLAPQSDFSFAPVVSALLISPGGNAERLVAESLRPQDDAELVSIRRVDGEIAQLVLRGEEARMRLLGSQDIILIGTRTLFGYRRGRLAERVSLIAENGDRYVLLIGVEMRDAIDG